MICKTIPLWDDKPEVMLSAYIQESSPRIHGGRPHPAVIVCPGGGYAVCAETEGEPAALQFAAMGYHAFVLRYSVSGRPGEETGNSTVYPAPALDLGKAILTLRAHAQEWRLDAEKIIVCGFSAGAHNCGMYLTDYDDPEICQALGADKNELRPAAGVLCYGLLDAVPLGAPCADAKIAAMNAGMCAALTGKTNLSEAELRRVSPVYRVREDTAPCFLWATAGDTLVPVQNSLDMARALAEKGVPFELHVFERGDHALSTAKEISAPRAEAVNDDAAKWVPLANAWLKKRFALPVL